MQVTDKFEMDGKALLVKLAAIRVKALDCFNIYWKGGVSGSISGLSSGDPASSATRLTKTQLTSGLLVADQLGNNLFENLAVATGDYMATIQSLKYGNATPTVISVAVEGYASKLVSLMNDLLDAYSDCWALDNYYSSHDLSTALAPLAGTDSVTTDGMTKDELIAGVVLAQQFMHFVNNAAVSQALYKTTLGLWAKY